MVKLGVLLRVAAVYMALVGVAFLAWPDAMMLGTLGAGASAALLGMIRVFASTFLGIAVLNWIAARAPSSPARDAIVLGNTVGFALAAILGCLAVVGGAPSTGVANVVVALAFAVAFFLAGRASMAARAG